MTFQTAIAEVGMDRAAKGADAKSSKENDLPTGRIWSGKAERMARFKLTAL